jgi:signal transduction histidine kinase
VCIEDTGPGIPRELQERVFEPFFTTKPVGEGTGLGLSIVYSIVKRHAGRVLLECPEGGGTRFTIAFPLASNPEHARAGE